MADEASGEGGSTGGHRMVVERNAVVAERVRRLEAEVWWSRRAILAFPLSVAATAWLARNEPRFVGIGSDGRVVPFVTLDRPVMPDGAVLDFAARAVRETMTFGFHDYEMRLGAAQREFFSDDAFAAFVEALRRQGVIEGLAQRRQVYQASIDGAPKLLDRGVFGGVLKYRVEVGLRINVMSGGKSETVAHPVRLILARATQVDKPYGVVVEQWAAVL